MNQTNEIRIQMLLLCFLISSVKCYSEKDVASFCKNNGYKYPTFVNFTPDITTKLFKVSSKLGINGRFVNHLDLQFNTLDFLIFDFQNILEFEKVFGIVSAHKIQRSLFIVQDIEEFKSFARKHMKNSLFFLFDGLNSWKQVLILNGNPNVVINDVSFDKNGLFEVNEGLQGEHLLTTGVTLNNLWFLLLSLGL